MENSQKLKNLTEQYIELEDNGASEDELDNLAHEIDHAVFHAELYMILNKIGEEKEIVALLIGEEESDESFFIPVYTSEEEANKAQTSARALFSGCGDDENMPTTTISLEELGEGIFIADLMVKCNLCASKGEAKRLIQQGGVSVNDEVVKDLGSNYKQADFEAGVKIRKGKKVFHKALLG